eukprot:2501576-Rhodomonas_salina.4
MSQNDGRLTGQRPCALTQSRYPVIHRLLPLLGTSSSTLPTKVSPRHPGTWQKRFVFALSLQKLGISGIMMPRSCNGPTGGTLA